jgi:hypothetical protein
MALGVAKCVMALKAGEKYQYVSAWKKYVIEA